MRTVRGRSAGWSSSFEGVAVMPRSDRSYLTFPIRIVSILRQFAAALFVCPLCRLSIGGHRLFQRAAQEPVLRP